MGMQQPHHSSNYPMMYGAPPAGTPAAAAAASSSSSSAPSLSLGAPPAAASAASAAAAAGVGSYSGLPSLAPSQLIPPLVAAYMPSMPPPSVVDHYKQPPALLSSVSGVAPNGAMQTLQVRKRFHLTDGVRVTARKKKQPRTTGGAGAAEPNLTSSREVPDKLDISLPGSDMVQKLLAMERRIDASIARKQVEIAHALATPKSTAAYMTPQVIRLFLWHEHSTVPAVEEQQHPTPHYGSHHHHHQSAAAAAAAAVASAIDKAESSCWMLKIQGHILEADVRRAAHQTLPCTRAASIELAGTRDEPAAHSSTAPIARCLSNYLSAIVVQIEGNPPAAAAAAASSSSSSPAAAASASSSSSSSVAAAAATPFPSSECIEWRKHSNIALSDGFEIRRRGGESSDVRLKISFFLDYSPPRFKVSSGLGRLLGLQPFAPSPLVAVHNAPPNPPATALNLNLGPFPMYETQSAVLNAFWEYVHKQPGLHEPKQNHIKCDAALSSLFGVSEIPVSSILSFLHLHLSPASAEAVVVPYVVRSSTASSAGPPPGLSSLHFAGVASATPSPSPVQCVDILTYAPMHLLPPAGLADTYKESATYSGIKSNSGPPPNIQTTVARHSEKLCELFLEMDKCNRRRELLQTFSESPTQVLHLLIAQQAKDNLLMSGLTGVDDELERRGEYFHGEWIFDAMDRYQQEEATTNSNAMQAAANVFANADGDDE